MSPVPYRTIQCYYRHVTGMRNHQCDVLAQQRPHRRFTGVIYGHAPTVDHIHVNWTEASATQRALYCRPLGLLPRPIPRFSRSHQPQECRQALKNASIYRVGLRGHSYGRVARRQISRRPGGGWGMRFSIDFVLVFVLIFY